MRALFLFVAVALIGMLVQSFKQIGLKSRQMGIYSTSESGAASMPSLQKKIATALIGASLIAPNALLYNPSSALAATKTAKPSQLKSALQEYSASTSSRTAPTPAPAPAPAPQKTASAPAPVARKSTQELQKTAASATVVAAVNNKAAAASSPPITKSASTPKSVPVASKPKQSVEEVAYESTKAQLEAEKDRLDIVSKTELPKAKDSLKKAKNDANEDQRELSKVEAKLNDKRRPVDTETKKALNMRRSELKTSLSFLNQEVKGYKSAVGRYEKEGETLKVRIKKDGDLVKERKDKFNIKTAQLKKDEREREMRAKFKEVEMARQEAAKATNYAKLKVLDAQKDYNNVVTKQNGFKDNVNNLENSLKTARKKESKQIERINSIRATLGKEMTELEKEQKDIIDISASLTSANMDVAGMQRDVDDKKAALKQTQERAADATRKAMKLGVKTK